MAAIQSVRQLEAPLSATAGHKLTMTTLRHLIRSKKKNVNPGILLLLHGLQSTWPLPVFLRETFAVEEARH